MNHKKKVGVINTKKFMAFVRKKNGFIKKFNKQEF